jgi:PAS domain S-box-containing protein
MHPSIPLPSSAPLRGADSSSVTAHWVVNHISALVAYWDADQRCVFANAAYLHWFGRTAEQMIGAQMSEVLGPVYEKNLPYIRGALAGQPQIFERLIPLPGGGSRDSIASYTPDVVDGVVRGFSVHVADVTSLRQREATLVTAIRETIAELEATKNSFRSKQLGVLRQRLQLVLDRLEDA